VNTQSNAINGSAFQSQTVVPAVLSPTRPFYWSLRREFWDNRWIYLAPLAAAAIFLIGFMVSSVHLVSTARAAMGLDLVHQHENMVRPYEVAAGFIMVSTLIVAIFYSLEALRSERRDRSILFWKSLPVSDRTTVLAKASIPIVILPLLTCVITLAVYFFMLLWHSAVLGASGLGVAMLWSQVSIVQMSMMLFYHMVTVHSLWHAPVYGWLLLVGGWARRAAFLWATLPVFALIVLEKIVFGTSHFGQMLENRFSGGPEAVPMHDTFPIDPRMHLTPGHFLISPGLWVGLALTAIFLAAAIRLRRHRGPL
jgi:ABC-2 type transport system permease protein